MQKLTIPENKVEPVIGEFYHYINKLTYTYQGCYQAHPEESYDTYWLIPTEQGHVSYYYYFIPGSTSVVIGALGGMTLKYDKHFLLEHLNAQFNLNNSLTLDGILGAITWEGFKGAIKVIEKPKTIKSAPPQSAYKWILSKKGLEQCTATAATSF